MRREWAQRFPVFVLLTVASHSSLHESILQRLRHVLPAYRIGPGQIGNRARQLDDEWLHWGLYAIAFLEGDRQTMAQEVEWARGKLAALLMLGVQAAIEGKLQASGQFLRQASDLAARAGLGEVAARLHATEGYYRALLGDTRGAPCVSGPLRAVSGRGNA